MSRREYGTGGLSQRTSDGRWIGTIEAGWTATGARRRVTVSGKTKAETQRRLRDKRLELDRDGSPVTSARTTVKAWSDTWLATKVAVLRPETFTSHRSAVRRWIVPVLGHKRLDALTPGDVRQLAKAQTDAGRTSSTALRTHAVLNSMLKDALLEGHRVPARVLAVKRPAVSVHDREAMTVHEAVAVLDQASRLPDGSRWAAALLQAMRQGECLGLTWAAVDFDRGSIEVSWQLQPLPYLDRRAGTFRLPADYEARHLEKAWHLVRPKTRKGWRVIPMVPWMRDALTTWRAAAPDSPHDLVWPRLDGRPADSKDDDQEWYGLQGAAEVGHPSGRYYTAHEARHTTVTLLLEAGIDPGVITAIVGHSTIATSRGYQHVSLDQARKAMDAVAARLQLTG